jgi:hypothetical protein
MTSMQASRHLTGRIFARLNHWLLLCLLVSAQPGQAEGLHQIPEATADTAEAWLITYGPGHIYWERFGHNAIWLREPAEGLDHTFNFGFFDFEQENFVLHFVRGRMLYFSVGLSAAREFEFYRGQNRTIRAQKLNLSPVQYQRLRDYLLEEIRPENRDYRYDYYLNNCSTRIRDALDLALDGVLGAHSRALPAELGFRDHTRRLTQMQFWYYLGLQIGLGQPTDRDITRWDEMFIPMVMADELAAMSAMANANPPVLEDLVLNRSTAPQPGATPDEVWPRYLLLSLGITFVAWLSGRFMPGVWLQGLCGAWILLAVNAGIVLAGLWLLTDHAVARPNANLLLFNPLVLLAFIPFLRKVGAALLAGGTAIAWVLLLYPGHQYNLDVLALATPINLAVAAHFWEARK